MIRRGPTMLEWHGARWRVGIAYPRFWHPWVRVRLRPFWLYTPVLRVWVESLASSRPS